MPLELAAFYSDILETVTIVYSGMRGFILVFKEEV
jgi:hypothetical protein